MSRLSAAWRRHGPLLRRLLLAAFLVTVAVLLVRQGMAVDWPAVGAAMRGYPAGLLAACAALTAAGYAVYCCYDLLAKRYVGHDVAVRRVLPVTFVSYAFNLNMGALIGGAGFRFRLYSQRGLRAGEISRVLAFSVVANWSGYVVLLGLALVAGAVPVPAGWELGAQALRWIGALMLLVAAAYLAACLFSPRRSLTLRGHEIVLPAGLLALGQFGLSMLHWTLVGWMVWLLLHGAAPYPTVLGVLLLGAVAGAVTHVPAGLGVIEAVFLVALPEALPRAEMLGALLTWRALYYIAPLLVAVVVYGVLEARGRRGGRRSAVGARLTRD